MTEVEQKGLGKTALLDADDVVQEDSADLGQHVSAERPKKVKAEKREGKTVERQTRVLEKLEALQQGL